MRITSRVPCIASSVVGTLLTLQVVTAQTVRIMPLMTNRMVANPADGMIYASIPTSAGPPHADTLAVIDPVAGEIVGNMPIGVEPGFIALSDTGRYAYVGVNGGSTVRRVDLTTSLIDLDFELGQATSTYLWQVQDMAVMPGNENTVAISLYHPNYSGQDVALFDNGVRRPLTASNFPGNSIAWGTSPNRLFVLNTRSSGYFFSQYTVGPTGLTLGSVCGGLISNFGVTMKAAGDTLVSTSGRRVDPEQLRIRGTYANGGAVEPDTAGGRVFYLGGLSSAPVLRIYDMDSYLEIGSLNINSSGFFRDLVRWGSDGLAYRTNAGQVVLINSPLVDSTLAGACCMRNGQCMMATFSTCLEQLGTWRGPDTDCAAAACPQPGACCLPDGSCIVVQQTECTGNWAGSGSNCNQTSCVPSPGEAHVRIVSLPNNGIAYSKTEQVLYATVPSSAGAPWGNSLVAIDPETSAILGSTLIGSEPVEIAISATGRFVYVGLYGAGEVRRYDTISKTAGLQFNLTTDTFNGPLFVYDLQAMPGNDNIVAVARQKPFNSPPERGVAIYDNGVQRPATTPGHTDSRSIAWSSSPSTLFGYGAPGVSVMNVHANGVSITQTVSGLFTGAGIEIRHADGFLYSSIGRKVDTTTMTLAGTFSASGTVAPEPARGRVYYAGTVSGGHILRAFNDETFSLEDSVTFSGASGIPRDLLRWGVNGLAFRTLAGQIVLADTPIVPMCWANCDMSMSLPVLTIDDFTCFINEFASAQSLPHEQQLTHYANCDGSTHAPVLNVDDFTCFINAFAAGCE